MIYFLSFRIRSAYLKVLFFYIHRALLYFQKERLLFSNKQNIIRKVLETPSAPPNRVSNTRCLIRLRDIFLCGAEEGEEKHPHLY